jgi:hypothetical protein
VPQQVQQLVFEQCNKHLEFRAFKAAAAAQQHTQAALPLLLHVMSAYDMYHYRTHAEWVPVPHGLSVVCRWSAGGGAAASSSMESICSTASSSSSRRRRRTCRALEPPCSSNRTTPPGPAHGAFNTYCARQLAMQYEGIQAGVPSSQLQPGAAPRQRANP